jgi:hypothetical protein
VGPADTTLVAAGPNGAGRTLTRRGLALDLLKEAVTARARAAVAWGGNARTKRAHEETTPSAE